MGWPAIDSQDVHARIGKRWITKPYWQSLRSDPGYQLSTELLNSPEGLEEGEPYTRTRIHNITHRNCDDLVAWAYSKVGVRADLFERL